MRDKRAAESNPHIDTPHRVDTRLALALPGWEQRSSPAREHVIGVLPGEGIGPEVMEAAIDVLRAVGLCSQCEFDIRYGGPIGIEAEEAHGQPLTPQVIQWCESIFADDGAILCGPGGGRFVYDLRAQFDLFCKLTPVRPSPALRDTGALRPELLTEVDMVIVRENTGGLYFGEGRKEADPAGSETAVHTFRYSAGEVQRILKVAVALAGQRSGRLCLVVKPAGLPAVSELWTDLFKQAVSTARLDTHVLEVDAASYQIIAKAHEFDVVVAPNLFGDILSDSAALLLGSRGLSYSGNFGLPGVAVYQTGHGAAYDIAGKGVANPIGQIMSAAMLLRESFGLVDAAASMAKAIERTLADDIRTADIAAAGSTVLATQEMGRRIAEAVEHEAPKAISD